MQFGLGYLTFVMSGASVGALLLLIALICQSVLLVPLPFVAVLVVLTPLMHLGMDWRAGIREGFGTLAAE